MRKFLLSLILAIFVCSGVGYADNARGSVRTVYSSTLINATATSTSSTYKISSAGYFGVWYKATSVIGAPDIKIEVQMSYDDTAANFVEPDDISDVVTNLTDENAHVESIFPTPMTYLNFLVTGNAGNQTDTLVTLYFFVQE